MNELMTILVPVDFSSNTRTLVSYATMMAHKLSATISFIHAVGFYPGDAMFGTPFNLEIKDKIESEANERMTNLLDDVRGDFPGCNGQVAEGDPTDVIIEAASNERADLIIISTHGAKGLEKILLGSVTERVLKRSPCPVLVMNPYQNVRY